MDIANFHLDPMAMLLTLGVIAVIWVLYKAQVKKDSFDVKTVILKEDGKISIHKVGQLVALIVSTWAFVYLVLHDKLTEVFYLTYMGVWASTGVLDKVASKPTPPVPPAGQ